MVSAVCRIPHRIVPNPKTTGNIQGWVPIFLTLDGADTQHVSKTKPMYSKQQTACSMQQTATFQIEEDRPSACYPAPPTAAEFQPRRPQSHTASETRVWCVRVALAPRPRYGRCHKPATSPTTKIRHKRERERGRRGLGGKIEGVLTAWERGTPGPPSDSPAGGTNSGQTQATYT